MSIYRKIYTEAYGKIPKDEQGRSYEIHHIDGNHSNNELSNLKCVTIEEHFNIHYAQGDWVACSLIAQRMHLSPEQKRIIASKNSKCVAARLIAEGRHNFKSSEWQTKYHNIRVANGTHHMLGDTNPTHLRIKNGTHNFQGENAPSKMYWKCIHCCKEGRGKGNFTRFHGKNCKILKE